MTDIRQADGRSERAPPRESSRRPGGTPFFAASATVSQADRERRDKAIFFFFIVQTLSVTVFQKIGFGGSTDSNVPLAAVAMLAGLAVLLVFVRPVFDVTRVGLYVAFVILAAGGTSLFADRYSSGSLLLLVLLYLPMAFAFPTSDGNYRRCMEFFSTVMVVMAGIAIAQLLIEFVASWLAWPNLDELLPQRVLIQGFNYIQPITPAGHVMKPNGIFFLEVSFLSQYLALALAAEIVLFQRFWRIALFAGTMLATFAGTGILLIALTLAVLLNRTKVSTMAWIVAGLVGLAWGAYELGWFDTVASRTVEYRHNGASANLRFVAPLDRLTDFLRTSPGSIYSGIGAGQIEKVGGAQWWPITKAVVEYGLLTGVIFHVFVFYALMSHPPYRRIAFTLAVWFSIEGALLTAVNPLTLALFSTLFVLDRGPKRAKRSEPEEAEERGSSGRRRRRRRSTPEIAATAT